MYCLPVAIKITELHQLRNNATEYCVHCVSMCKCWAGKSVLFLTCTRMCGFVTVLLLGSQLHVLYPSSCTLSFPWVTTHLSANTQVHSPRLGSPVDHRNSNSGLKSCWTLVTVAQWSLGKSWCQMKAACVKKSELPHEGSLWLINKNHVQYWI